MGKPKFSRKIYETPSHPWQADRIKEENELIKKYGLKNKREVWKAKTRLRKYRGQARELLAKVRTKYVQSKKESDQLLMHLSRMNILPINSTLDDVLALETESILSRRLQTLTYLKGLANTPDQARQIISHGHIGIGEKRVTVPGYMVTKDEEGEIGYTSDSPLNDVMHPARPRADFKSVPGKEETKPKEPKEKVKEEPPKEEEKPSEKKPEEKPTEDKKTEETPKEDEPSEEPQKEEASPTESTTEKKPEEQPKEETVGKKNQESEKPDEDKKEGD